MKVCKGIRDWVRTPVLWVCCGLLWLPIYDMTPLPSKGRSQWINLVTWGWLLRGMLLVLLSTPFTCGGLALRIRTGLGLIADSPGLAPDGRLRVGLIKVLLLRMVVLLLYISLVLMVTSNSPSKS